jgi:hypothetical protein
MLVACKHPNGINASGVILAGGSTTTSPGSLDGKRRLGEYALTEVPDDHRDFLSWLEANEDSSLLKEGVVVVGVNEGELRIKIFNGSRHGRYEL